MLDRLCLGDPCRLNTVLTTTKWGQGRAEKKRQLKREMDLSVRYPARQIPRFSANNASAWHVIDVVLCLPSVSAASVRNTFFDIAEKSPPPGIIIRDFFSNLFG